MPRNFDLPGAACQELPMQVVDHFFEASNSGTMHQRVMARAAFNICMGHCPVQQECLTDALNGPRVQRGTIAGHTAEQINLGRSWIQYELGVLDQVPTKGPRPVWLPRSDAAESAEVARLDEDADEPAPGL